MKWSLGISDFLEEISAAAKLLQSCPTLCSPIDSLPTRLPCPWDSPGKNTGVGCHFLLQKRSLVSPILLFPSISLHWSLRRLSYIFLLFFGTLHSDVSIFPFLLCFSLLFFSQLFVRPPQTAILLFCISFPWGSSWSLSPVQTSKFISLLSHWESWVGETGRCWSKGTILHM